MGRCRAKERCILTAILLNEGLILAVIGIVGIVEGFRLNRLSAAAEEAYGPGWYLLILSVILIVCGLYHLATSFKKTREATSFWKGPAALCILAMMMYTVLIPYVGYFIGSAVFLFIATRLFGEKSWLISSLLAGIGSGVLWLIFIYLAEIPMP